MIIYGPPEALAKWAETMMPECAPIYLPLTTFMGFANMNGEIQAVAFFNNYRHNDKDIEFSMIAATPRWATPGNIRAILHYAFVQLGVERLTVHTAKSNKRARRILARMGARMEGVHPRAHLGKSTKLSYCLHRKDAGRWIA